MQFKEKTLRSVELETVETVFTILAMLRKENIE